MKIVNVPEAKSTLSALLNEVEQGEEVTVARNGAPVAKLVRASAPSRREPGLLRKHPAWANFAYEPGLFALKADADPDAEGWL